MAPQSMIGNNEKRFRSDLTLHPDCPVFQLTTSGTLNIGMYFTHPSYLPGSHQLVFISDRTKIRELYTVDIDSGDISQLSKNANVEICSWEISPDGKFILYFGGQSGQEFRRIFLDTLEDELILIRPSLYNNWRPSIIDISPDNNTFYMCSRFDWGGFPSNLFVGSISDHSYKPFFSLDIEKNHFFDHQMLSPTNPNLMQINCSPLSSAGRENPQRMWLLDLHSHQLHPLYNQNPHWWSKFDRVCHESWMSDGQHLVFVVRRDKVKACGIDGPFGQETHWIIGQGPNFWHVSGSPNGKMLVADTMWRDSGLWLIEYLPNHIGHLFNLCLTKSEWQDPWISSLPLPQKLIYGAHPHPGFSPDGKFVHFTAYQSKTRSVQLFVVSVPKNPFN